MRRTLFVRVNRMANWVVRRLGLRRFRGGDLLFLTTTGRKSGQQRTTPALYLRDGQRWVVAASNGGADWEPGWWLNLRAGTPASVEVDGMTTEVTGSSSTARSASGGGPRSTRSSTTTPTRPRCRAGSRSWP